MELLLRGGRVIDPEQKSDGKDVRIIGGVIAEIGSGLTTTGQTIDCQDWVISPGFVDLHVHFREPGQEYKEDIESGARSAAIGGFSTTCCMPNTNPVNDCRSVTDLMMKRAEEANLARVLPIGAITKGLKGKQLAEFGEMKEAGIVAVSDDGRPVMHAGLMRRALEYARTFGLPVVQHAEDLELAEGGVMNEGEVSVRLGLKGQPPESESVMVARDIELVSLTGGQYHVAHLSAQRSVEMVREAKRRGLPVTAEVTPHHFTLTDESCHGYDTSAKVMPPLRASADRDAVIQGIVDGTIDCIATDHAPHSDVEKDVEFGCASPGLLGLETSLPLGLNLVRDGIITIERLVHLMTLGGARVFGLEKRGIGRLQVGKPADICVFDPGLTWSFSAHDSGSKSHNSPFDGTDMVGAAMYTLRDGRVIFDRQKELG